MAISGKLVLEAHLELDAHSRAPQQVVTAVADVLPKTVVNKAVTIAAALLTRFLSELQQFEFD